MRMATDKVFFTEWSINLILQFLLRKIFQGLCSAKVTQKSSSNIFLANTVRKKMWKGETENIFTCEKFETFEKIKNVEKSKNKPGEATYWCVTTYVNVIGQF